MISPTAPFSVIGLPDFESPCIIECKCETAFWGAAPCSTVAFFLLRTQAGPHSQLVGSIFVSYRVLSEEVCFCTPSTSTALNLTTFQMWRVNYPFKAEWYLYVPDPLAISKFAFSVYGFCMVVIVSSDYFLKQR
jgi:hypothetical protein